MKTLHQAARADDLEALRSLLRAGAEVDSRDDGVTPLMLAVGQSANDSVRLLVDEGGADVNLECRGSTPLVFACCQGYAETAAILLSAGAEVNTVDSAGWTPLMHAAFCGWETVLHLLLDYRSDLSLQNLDGHTALDLAIQARQPITAVILRDHGASINCHEKDDAVGQVQWISETARLLYSAIHGDVETLRELLTKSANMVDLRDDTDQTLLMLAAQNGRYHVVELLLDSGAQIEAESMAGRTALMHAVDAGYINTARLLLRRGATPSRRSSADWSALSLASSREDVEMVRMIIEETSETDLADLDYDAALIWSRRSDRPDITLLLENARPKEKAA